MNKKDIKIFLIIIFLIGLFTSCIKKENFKLDETTVIAKEKFIIKDIGLFDKSEIFLMRNMSKGQILSVVVKDENNNLIIFDGGRIEDADFLYRFIKSNNGKVKHWFLTHIHDDHIGALYEICRTYKDINIENIYYNFASLEWYTERAGDDGYAKVLLENSINDYKNYKKEAGIDINIYDNIKKGDVITEGRNSILVLNNLYKIDSDPINNSSITYKMNIENKSLIVLGDLGYYGGEKLLEDYKNSNVLKSNIAVMSHHGQNGVYKDVYEKIKPDICLWPTTKSIYENKEKKYKTDETKEWVKELGVKYNIVTIDYSYIIK